MDMPSMINCGMMYTRLEFWGLLVLLSVTLNLSCLMPRVSSSTGITINGARIVSIIWFQRWFLVSLESERTASV